MSRGAIAIGGAMAGACVDVSSADLKTDGMYADLSVEADGTGNSTARGILKAGGATSTTFVDLDGNDRLTVALEGGEPQEMVQQSLGAVHHYVTTYNVAPVGIEFAFALERTIDAGAPRSTVELPPEFAIAPPGKTAYSRLDDDLVLEWSPPSSEPMALWVNGACIQAYALDLPTDGGSYVIPRGTLQPVNTTVPESCELELVLTRRTYGTIDPAFGEGGLAEGRQVRRVNVTSGP